MNNTITNLQLSIIMSAYVGNGMYCEGYDLSSDAYQRQSRQLLNEGIIKQNFKSIPAFVYDITEKGKFYLDSLLATPFPVEVKSWEIPK